MKKTWKKALSAVLTLAMVTTLAPVTVLADEGGSVDLSSESKTIEADGTYSVGSYTGKNTLTIKADATVTLKGVNITADTDESAISIVSGDVTLIVEGENTLTGGDNGAGIYVAEEASVTIQGEGELTAIGNAGTDDASGAAGIGGTWANGNSGAITIDGATVVAKGYGVHGSGIGSGSGKVAGEIKIINKANVTAYGGYYEDGKGAILDDKKYGSSDAEGGAAIGGGGKTASTIADITIKDSTVTAYGGSKAAGIGANFWSSCGTITIKDDSVVTAYGGSSSAGIGTSRAGEDGVTANIVISKSTVTATGGDYGAGIGGGYNADSVKPLPEISITISGGKINATGGRGGAAIGGGYKTNNLVIDITDNAEVTAKAGELVYEKTVEKGGSPCAIGSGANGSGEFVGSVVTIENLEKVKTEAYDGGKPAIEGLAVAKIGNDKYETLEAAVKAAKDGNTIVLLMDVEGSGVVIDKDITIDFNGKTYTFTEPAVGSAGTQTNGFQILKNNDVTLKNGTLEVSEEYASKFAMLIQNYANLTVEDMKLDGTNLDYKADGTSYTLSNNCGKIEITGNTKIIANDNGRDSNKAFAFDAYAYTNGSYTAPVVTFDKNFTGEVDGKFEVYPGATLVIYAGTFGMKIQDEWCATGLQPVPVENADGKWTVAVSDDAVAEIDGVYFETLKDAVEAAENGDTITMLKSTSGSGVVINKKIEINFNDTTYTFTTPAVGSAGTTTNGFQILKEAGEVTLKDGTLEIADANKGEYYILVQNYADLTVKDMILDGTNLDKYSGTDGDSYTLSNNSGEVTITGDTTIIANDEGDLAYAFDVCKFGNYDAPTVTFNAGFTGGVQGKFEVSEGLEDNLDIYAGYFTAYPKAYVVDGKTVKSSDKDGYTYMVDDPASETPSTSSSSKSSSKKYTVEIEDTDDGTVKASSTRVKKGATVTLTVTPDDGYELDEIIVLDKDGDEVDVTDKGNGKFTFTMPKGGVTVETSFEEAEDEKEPVVEDTDKDASAGEVEEIILTVGQKIAWVFDEYVVNDVAPVIRNDRTMLPIRFVAEALGATVTWDEPTQTVTIVKGDLDIEIYIGQAFAKVNGTPVQLDSPAFIENDRTYLPLRFVAENLGATVTWDADTQKVTIIPGE